MGLIGGISAQRAARMDVWMGLWNRRATLPCPSYPTCPTQQFARERAQIAAKGSYDATNSSRMGWLTRMGQPRMHTVAQVLIATRATCKDPQACIYIQ